MTESIKKKMVLGADLVVLIKSKTANPHGYVTRLPDSPIARCGGPTMCLHCFCEMLDKTFDVVASEDLS